MPWLKHSLSHPEFFLRLVEAVFKLLESEFLLVELDGLELLYVDPYFTPFHDRVDFWS